MGAVAEHAIITHRRKASRLPEVMDQGAYLRHIKRIGEIVYLWNQVHANLFQMFFALVDRSNYQKAHQLWHTVHSDKAQREMVEKLARTSLSKRLKSHVLWVCRCHEKLSPFRNAYVHVDFMYDYDEDEYVPLSIAARAQSIVRIESEDRAVLFRNLRGDLAALHSYSSDLAFRLAYNDPSTGTPWLERPKMKLVDQRASAKK